MSRQMTAGPASGRVMRQRTAGAVDGASSSQRAPRYRNATYTEVDDVQASHERMELVGEHSSTSDALLAPSPAQDVQRAQLSDSAVLDAAVVPQEQLHFSDLGPAAERAARRGDAGPFPALALDDAPLFGAAPRAWRRPAGTLGATGTAESGERNFLRVAQGLRVAPAARNDDEATATRVASLAQRMDALRQDVAAAVPARTGAHRGQPGQARKASGAPPRDVGSRVSPQPLFDVLETHVRRVAAERDAERVRREELQRGAESLALLVADMAGQAQAHPQAHVERERVAEAAPEPAAPARAAASEAPSESPARTVEAEFRQLGGGGHKPAAPVARGGVVEVASGSAVTGGGSGGTWSVGKRETTTQRPTAVRDYLPKDRPPDTEDYLRAQAQAALGFEPRTQPRAWPYASKPPPAPRPPARPTTATATASAATESGGVVPGDVRLQGLVALALDALAPDATPEKIMGAKTAIEAALRGGPAEPAPAPDAAGAAAATTAPEPSTGSFEDALRQLRAAVSTGAVETASSGAGGGVDIVPSPVRPRTARAPAEAAGERPPWNDRFAAPAEVAATGKRRAPRLDDPVPQQPVLRLKAKRPVPPTRARTTKAAPIGRRAAPHAYQGVLRRQERPWPPARPATASPRTPGATRPPAPAPRMPERHGMLRPRPTDTLDASPGERRRAGASWGSPPHVATPATHGAAGAGREDSATLAGDPMDQWARAALRRTEDRLDALMGIIQQRLPATPNAMGSDDAEDATRGYLGGGGARAAEASADATEGGVSVMESAELDGLIQRLRAMEAAEQRIRDRWLEPQREQSAAPVPESAPGPTAAPRTPGGAVASGRVAWGDVREEVGGGEGPVTQDMAKRVAAGRRAFLRRQQLLDSLLHAGGPKFDVGQAVEAVAEELLDEVIESTARNVDELTAEAVDALMAAELRGVR